MGSGFENQGQFFLVFRLYEFKVCDLGFDRWGLGIRVSGSGLRVSCVGARVWGLLSSIHGYPAHKKQPPSPRGTIWPTGT